MAEIDWSKLTRAKWTAPKFTAAQITAAQNAVAALPSVDDDPNHIALLWPMATKFPNISDIDFGDAYQSVVTLGDLKAATDATHQWLNRAKVASHITRPGQPIASNPFTQTPLVTATQKGDLLIVDGHHRLAALMFLGCTKWQLWTVPTAKALGKSPK